MDKNELRKHVLSIRKSMSEEELGDAGNKLTEKIMSLKEYKEALNILLYVSYNNEADTAQLIKYSIELGKNVYLPKVYDGGIMHFYKITSPSDCKPGYKGIPEPDEKKCLMYDSGEDTKSRKTDIIICPGVVYDRCNNRIGYGGGYYDRFLSSHDIISIAPAYNFQLTDHIYGIEKTDRRINIIITLKEELRWNI